MRHSINLLYFARLSEILQVFSSETDPAPIRPEFCTCGRGRDSAPKPAGGAYSAQQAL